MKLNRRNFLRISGTAAAASAIPLQAGILFGKSGSQDIVLGSGLPTDIAFAQGIIADTRMVTLTDSINYAELISQLAAGKGKRLFALLPSADAILLEQALRDSNKRDYTSRSVKAPSSDSNIWARTLGEQLAMGSPVTLIQSRSGLPLVAVTANL